MPNEENFADDLEVLILAVQNKCKYFPPQFIVDEYEAKKEKRIKRRIDRLNTSSSQNVINYRNKSPINVIDDETDVEVVNEENNSQVVNNDHENIRITVENPNYNTFSDVNNSSVNSTENSPPNTGNNSPSGSPLGSGSNNTVV